MPFACAYTFSAIGAFAIPLMGKPAIALGITFQVDLGDLSILNGKMEALASGKDGVLNGILASGSPNDVSTTILSIATGMQALRSDNTTFGELLRYN